MLNIFKDLQQNAVNENDKEKQTRNKSDIKHYVKTLLCCSVTYVNCFVGYTYIYMKEVKINVLS